MSLLPSHSLVAAASTLRRLRRVRPGRGAEATDVRLTTHILTCLHVSMRSPVLESDRTPSLCIAMGVRALIGLSILGFPLLPPRSWVRLSSVLTRREGEIVKACG